MAQVLNYEEALKKANSLYVDEHFKEALEYYSLAVELEEKEVEAYLKRSLCHTKLENFTDALADAQKAIGLQPNNSKAYLRKGIACFEMEEYESALAAFEKGFSLDSSDQSFKTWIRKCKAEIEGESADGTTSTTVPAPTPTASTNGTTTTPTPTHSSTVPRKPAPSTTPTPAPQSTPTPAPAAQKIRHEWYQNPSQVFVSVFAKGVKKDNITVDFGEQSLSVQIKLADSNSYVLDLELADSIDPSQSSFEVLSTKIEIKLKKAASLKWDTLEKPAGVSPVSRPYEAAPTTANSNQKKNWDKIMKDEYQEEKLDGEAGLNKVFQDIFSNATDEQRRAMMKSFTESGGTVLSTNWDEVGKAPVKGSPPQGMEMHKWSE